MEKIDVFEKNKCHQKVLNQKTISPSTFVYPLRENLLNYALNLAGNYSLKKEILTFIVSLFDFNLNLSIIDTIHEHGGFSANEEYINALKNISEYEQWVKVIYTDLINGEIQGGYQQLRETFRDHLNQEICLVKGGKNASFLLRMETLKNLFNLNNDDIEIINFIYCLYSTSTSFFRGIVDDVGFFEFLKITSTAIGLPFTTVKSRLLLKNRLFQSGVVTNIDTGITYGQFVSLDDSIEQYLSGISDITLIDNYITVDTRTAYDIGSYCINEISIDIIQSLLNTHSPCNILLYGVAGTGKSEFARSIVASVKKKALFLKYNDSTKLSNDCNNSQERIKSLTIINKLLTSDDGILIIDESDFILNTKSNQQSSKIDKGWLNTYLDTSNVKILWITNNISSMDDSTLRRFSYSMFFDVFTHRERKNIWEIRLRNNPLKEFFPESLVRNLSREYCVNAGGISSAIDTLQSYVDSKMIGSIDAGRVELIIRDLLSRHERIISGEDEKTGDQCFKELTDKYDISILNCDIDILYFIRSLEGYINCFFESREILIQSMNLLFWGPPGTGKTEFVKYLSQKMRIPLLIKRYSDIESPYVGVSEKNIKDSFIEARRSRAILLIDEADSFFTQRETAYRSWEVSRTNEFLTQMENHSGIFICCTNLLPNLDRAVMRRFAWKVEFKPLKDDSKLALYVRLFDVSQKSLTDSQIDRIISIKDLTPGDIKAVWLRYLHRRISILDHDVIIAELEKESFYNTAGHCVIGF